MPPDVAATPRRQGPRQPGQQ